jgi:outer membrane lipoprotein-sorting protein
MSRLIAQPSIMPRPASSRRRLSAGIVIGTTMAAGLGGAAWLFHPPGTAPQVHRGSGVAHAQTATHSNPAGVALWKRTLRASREAPLIARATVTRWPEPNQPGLQQVMDIVEGPGGRFRFTYVAPATIKGRVILSDGKQVHQYEPTRQLVLRRPVAPRQLPLESTAVDASLSGRRVSLKPDKAVVAGRTVRILEMHGTDATLRERRWVDDATGRSLKVEEYAPTGRLLRRIELTGVNPSKETATSTRFRPDFPSTVRVLSATAKHAPNAVEEARRLGLPREAGSYRVHAAVLPTKAMAPADATGKRQLLYSDGVHAVSLFVTEGAASRLRSEPGWQQVTLAPGIQGQSHAEDGQGRAAVAWLRNGHRYIAVARLPLPQLLEVARNLIREPLPPSAR